MVLSKKILLISALALIPLQAYAADPATAAPAREGHMSKADTNKDGVISKAEFVADAEAKFKQMDANNDGSITKDEMKAAHDKMKARFASKAAAAPVTK